MKKKKKTSVILLSLSLSHTHTLSLSFSLTRSYPAHTKTFFVSFTLPHTHTRTHIAHTHKHTRAHSTDTHTHTHSYQQFLFKMQHQRKKLSTGKKDNRVGKLVLTKKKKKIEGWKKNWGKNIFCTKQKTRKIIFLGWCLQCKICFSNTLKLTLRYTCKCFSWDFNYPDSTRIWVGSVGHWSTSRIS